MKSDFVKSHIWLSSCSDNVKKFKLIWALVVTMNENHWIFVIMLRGLMMVWLVIQLALGKASSAVWLLLCWSPGCWWSKL